MKLGGWQIEQVVSGPAAMVVRIKGMQTLTEMMVGATACLRELCWERRSREIVSNGFVGSNEEIVCDDGVCGSEMSESMRRLHPTRLYAQ